MCIPPTTSACWAVGGGEDEGVVRSPIGVVPLEKAARLAWTSQ